MAFDAKLEIANGIGRITLSGELDASVAGDFRTKIEEAASQKVSKLVLILDALEYMSSAGLRTLVFAKQKMGQSVKIYVVGATEAVSEPIKQTGFHYSVIMMDTYDPGVIES
ncbi:MAG: anti-sigma factor antagonist [Anaerolineae bacterium]|nr:anti-sigma factor antagonist [Anaerolineae bacterium]NUQ02816.1 anti-sigma factor antagonist [Anaerolineae bacterium]